MVPCFKRDAATSGCHCHSFSCCWGRWSDSRRLRFNHPGRATGVLQDLIIFSLSAAKEEKHLHVRWDRTAPPVRNAQHAVLTILDGQYKTDVKLDYAQLQNPSMF